MRDWDKEQSQAQIDNHQVYGGTYECPENVIIANCVGGAKSIGSMRFNDLYNGMGQNVKFDAEAVRRSMGSWVETEDVFSVVFMRHPLPEDTTNNNSARDRFIHDCLDYDDLVDEDQIIAPPWEYAPVVFLNVTRACLDTIVEISKDDGYHDWEFVDEDYVKRAIDDSKETNLED